MTEAEQLDTQYKAAAAEQDNLEDYDEWVMLYSEADECNYFYNQWTGESQFDVPEAWAEQQAAPGYCKESLALSMSPLLSATLRLQAQYRAKRARRQPVEILQDHYFQIKRARIAHSYMYGPDAHSCVVVLCGSLTGCAASARRSSCARKAARPAGSCGWPCRTRCRPTFRTTGTR